MVCSDSARQRSRSRWPRECGGPPETAAWLTVSDVKRTGLIRPPQMFPASLARLRIFWHAGSFVFLTIGLSACSGNAALRASGDAAVQISPDAQENGQPTAGMPPATDAGAPPGMSGGACKAAVPTTSGGTCPVLPSNGLVCDLTDVASGWCSAPDCAGTAGCCSYTVNPHETCFSVCGSCASVPRDVACVTQGTCVADSDCIGSLPHICQNCPLAAMPFG